MTFQKILFGLFKKSTQGDIANDLYLTIVRQARNPLFYEAYGVADTLEGRFDMIVAHAFLVLRRFKADHEKTQNTGQNLFDMMFADLDRSLRELGIGDVGVSVRIKKMVEAFYGRIDAYEKGLEKGGDVLEAALLRNMYHGQQPTPDQVRTMANYLRAQIKNLDTVAVDAFLDGTFSFISVAEISPLEGDSRNDG